VTCPDPEGPGRVVAEAIVVEYGRGELLRRLSHPFWFQSFGAVMGMDWHSSGITTSVVGALQRGLGPLERELGLKVCGGRGKRSRSTPGELEAFGERTGLDGAALAVILRRVRSDVKVMTNSLLEGIPELEEYCIFVDPFHGPGSVEKNAKACKQAVEWLHSPTYRMAFCHLPAAYCFSNQR